MTGSPRITWYITAHGYGHGVRSCDILAALRAAAPSLDLEVVTDLPPDFLRSRVDLPPAAIRPGAFDVGMVQRDSICVDLDATADRLRDLLAVWPARLAAERARLRADRPGLVVCDIPAIPIEAARAEGIPAVAIGNFGWDWIYEEFTGRAPIWADAAARFRDGYALADLLLQYPFSEPMAAFPRREPQPLVASPGRNRRAELAAAYGIDPARRWVLLSFTTLDWDATALARVAAIDDTVFLTVRPLAWDLPTTCAVDRDRFPFCDVIATADAVISKPGFGILSECVVNDKPLLYVERTDFREYPVLEAALRRHLRHRHLPVADLYRGDLAPHLTGLAGIPPPREPLPAGGARLAAQRLLRMV
jgi:L-arabinokinase